MSNWTSDELERIGAADELQLAVRRRDGTLRKPVTIWVVRLDDDLYIRSAYGPTAAWYRGTQARNECHIRAGGLNKDVAVVAANAELDDQIDAAYAAKYGRYPQSLISLMTSPEARATTLELVP